MFKKTLDYGGAGDNVGCLLRTVKREDVQRGQVSKCVGGRGGVGEGRKGGGRVCFYACAQRKWQ